LQVDEPRLQTELDELTRRLLAMPLVDQYKFGERVELLLNLDQPLLKDEAVKRRETLTCLQVAMAHLGVERPLTTDEYAAARSQLGLSWSMQRILRLWKSFELAAQAAAGAPLPRTWQQRDFTRRFLAGRRPRGCEEYLTAVRIWLAAEPLTESTLAYDQFARQHNLTLEEGGLPLPRLATITNRLALPFSEIVAVARGDVPYPDVVAKRRDAADWSVGPHDLVCLRTLTLMCGGTSHQAGWLSKQGHFPRAALVVSNRRMWLREELADYLAGARKPPLEENRLRPQYLTAPEVGGMLVVHPRTLVKTDGFPPPVARVASLLLWLRADVEDYAEAHTREIEVRRRRRPRQNPSTGSQFMTLAAIARELEMGAGQAQDLVEKDGFPPPVRRFGDSGIWLRKDIEAYLANQPVGPTCALAELLMDVKEVNELMALSPKVHKRDYRDLPPAVARTKSGNVYLRSDIEAKLDADPEARRRLEQRRQRRVQRS
jgi:predicted DNA-binding transcriptional regulator AlpA